MARSNAVKSDDFDSPHMRARRAVLQSIQTAVKQRKLKQVSAAKACGVAQPRFNRLMRKSETPDFSLDSLINIAISLRIPVTLNLDWNDAAGDESRQRELAL